MNTWPYGKPAPGPDETYACPECGGEAVCQCWHPETGAVQTVLMTKTEAWRLRNGNGRLVYSRRFVAQCAGCGHALAVRSGALIGSNFVCDLCAPGPLHSRYCLGVREARRDVSQYLTKRV